MLTDRAWLEQQDPDGVQSLLVLVETCFAIVNAALVWRCLIGSLTLHWRREGQSEGSGLLALSSLAATLARGTVAQSEAEEIETKHCRLHRTLHPMRSYSACG
jgi:hypothetical protein